MANNQLKSKGLTISTRAAYQLGQAIVRFRDKAKLTQSELAKSAGLRQATVSKVETGVGTTEIKTIYAICAALHLDLVLRPRQTGDDAPRIEDIFK